MISRWQGILCPIGAASRRSPSGARGHRLIVSPQAAECFVNLAPGQPLRSSHVGNPRIDAHSLNQIGEVRECEIVDNNIVVSGVAEYHDSLTIRAQEDDRFGISFEINNAHIEDMRACIWTLTKFAECFGVAIASLAAFESRFEWLGGLE